MALKMFLFQPSNIYTGGALAVAAHTVAEAEVLAHAYYGENLVRATTYSLAIGAMVDDCHVPGVDVHGEPRIIFDHTYEE